MSSRSAWIIEQVQSQSDLLSENLSQILNEKEATKSYTATVLTFAFHNHPVVSDSLLYDATFQIKNFISYKNTFWDLGILLNYIPVWGRVVD